MHETEERPHYCNSLAMYQTIEAHRSREGYQGYYTEDGATQEQQGVHEADLEHCSQGACISWKRGSAISMPSSTYTALFLGSEIRQWHGIDVTICPGIC